MNGRHRACRYASHHLRFTIRRWTHATIAPRIRPRKDPDIATSTASNVTSIDRETAEGNETVLCLIRHGETDWNAERRMQGRSDIPLNARGIRQADLVAARLAGSEWDAIVSSPLVRVMEVARRIANAIGIPEDRIEARDDLMERTFGEAEGLTLAERTERFGASGPIRGIESYEELDDRVMRALREIEEAHRGQRVLVVAHGGVITGVLERLGDDTVGHGRTFIRNASLTTLVVNGDRWELGDIDDAEHLIGTDVEPLVFPATGSGQSTVRT